MTITITVNSTTGSDVKLVDVLRKAVTQPFGNSASQYIAVDPTLTLGSPTGVVLQSSADPFVYNGIGALIGGTVTSVLLKSTNDGITRVTVTGLSVDASDLYDAMIANDDAAIKALLFSDDLNFIGNNGDDIFIAGDGNDTLDGGLGSDTLAGGDGDDWIVAASGSDVLDGGLGNDTFVLDANVATIGIADAGGFDAVNSTVSRSIAGFVGIELLQLQGTADIDGTGNASANTIFGNSGDNILDGGGGNDSLIGGSGDDTYVLGADADLISEVAGISGGVDTITTTISRSLLSSANYANIENLTLLGGAFDGTGNTLDNVITGNADDNTLDGGLGHDTLHGHGGADTLKGSDGNDDMDGGGSGDTYALGGFAAVVADTGISGIDLITSTITRSLAGTGVEDLTLLGSASIDGTGNELDNTITGNSGNNVLEGKGGDDSLAGGLGNDTYVLTFDDADAILDSGGNDTVASVNGASIQSFIDIENVLLLGAADIDGYGNAGVNVITGNSGHNNLDGGTGADTLHGGAGNDTYWVDDAGDSGIDSSGADRVISTIVNVSLTAFAGVEDLWLQDVSLGNGASLNGTGNALANTITGNSGDNVLDGGVDSVVDSLIGGAGDDTFVLGVGADSVSDSSGDDTITSTITRSLALQGAIENLTLLGAANIDGTGNTLANTVTGNSGKNILDGGLGLDTLIGKGGDDIYLVDADGDVVIEAAGGGWDTVKSSSNYTLGGGVENLILLAGSGAVSGIGNGLVNTITGNASDNVLDGAGGTDTLIGGTGDDTYVLGFLPDDVIVDSQGADTVTSMISRSLAPFAAIERLTLLGAAHIDGTGNALANTITGNSGKNILDGAGGGDTLIGQGGDDTYIVDGSADIVVELAGEGTDAVRSSVSYALGQTAVENLVLLGTANINGTGNDEDNIITGNSGNNVLDGGSQGIFDLDTLIGNGGNDTFALRDGNDVVLDSSGHDTISSTISRSLAGYAMIEDLTLVSTGNINGTGNALANILTGNSGNNVLDGGLGSAVDTLSGQGGNDTYVLADGNDLVTDTAGADTITSTITRSLAAYAVIENLTLVGSASIDGSGNALNNTIQGNSGDNDLEAGPGVDRLNGGGGQDRLHGGGDAGADILDGQQGDDTLVGGSAWTIMEGGAGDDTFVLGSLTHLVSDVSGTDTITSTITRSLAPWGSEIENLTLLGSANVNGTGNGLDNVLTGSSGKNTLEGLGGDDTLVATAGVDTLKGGADNDTYVLGGYFFNTGATANTLIDTGGTDTITSTIDRMLSSFVGIENLTLLGNGHLDGLGTAAANKIVGNAGKNTLSGFGGSDELQGGSGDDTLVGGMGRDFMTGGAGADIFDFNDVSESGNGSTRDVIIDFVHLADRIDLSTIDANGGLSGNTAFSFLAAAGAAFTGAAGQLRWHQSNLPGTALDKTFIQGDVDGDGAADFQIQLAGLKSLTSADFLL